MFEQWVTNRFGKRLFLTFFKTYNSDYRDYLAFVKEFVDGLENVQTIRRNGLHHYNNRDHAMLTGMLAVHNLILTVRSFF